MILPEDETKPEATPDRGTPDPAEESASRQGESFPTDMFADGSALPEDFTPLGDISQLPRARRRRARRMLVPPGEEQRTALLDSLARRAFPSFEFFLFALLAGAVLGAAYLLDSPALLLLGLLLAPILNPWAGMLIAALTGVGRFFLQTLLGILVAGLIVFLTGTLAGFAGRLWAPLTLFHADIHAHLWLPDFLVVSLGAGLLAVAFTRSDQNPILPGLLLGYGFFLPLSAAGVGLGIADPRLWPAGVGSFLVYLALATLVGLIVLLVLRFKPAQPAGYLLSALLLVLSLAGLIGLTGMVDVIRNGITSAHFQRTTATVFALPSATPSRTVSLTPTPEPSGTPTLTPTLEATPAYAVITAVSGGGALLRTEPGGGSVIKPLSNGLIVEVLPEIQSAGTQIWVHVRTAASDGWVLQTVLTATTLTPTSPPTATRRSTP
jgi:hypothetical protein